MSGSVYDEALASLREENNQNLNILMGRLIKIQLHEISARQDKYEHEAVVAESLAMEQYIKEVKLKQLLRGNNETRQGDR